MTVKKLTAIENGRLVPTDLSMDADLIEISKVEGNALEVKEDGLYYKESIVVDGDSALNVVSGKLTVVVSPVGDNILQKTVEGLYVPTQGNPLNITTSDINEGTNLFFTESRVNQTVLTGLDTNTATPVLDTDQILAAIGKLQAQINNISSGGGTAFYPSFTGNAGKVLTVNATEDGVEWTTISNGSEDDSGDDEPISSTIEPMLVTPSDFNISISSASDLEIDWGDGTVQTVKSGDDTALEHLGLICKNYTHTYTDSYTDKTISIKHLDGESPIQFFTSGAIKTVERWYSEGYQPFRLFNDSIGFNRDLTFYGLGSQLETVPNIAPPKTTVLSCLFQGAQAFNQDISMWDVSKVVNMDSMFLGVSAFNQPLNSWDTSNVTNMNSMFNGASVFNQDIGTWNVSKVTNMNAMFFGVTAFNQDLSQWCVPSITSSPRNFATNSALITDNFPIWGTCPSGETLTLLPVTNVSLTIEEDITSPCNGATPAAVLTGYNVIDMTQPPTVDVYVQNILVAENVGATWLNQNWFINQALIENSNLLGYSVTGTSSNTELFQYYGDGNITFRFVPKTDGFYNGQVYSAKDALQIHYSNYNPTVYKDPSTGVVTFCIGGAN